MKMIVGKPDIIGAQPKCKPSETGTMGHPQVITNPLVRAIPPLLNGDSPAVGKHERRDIGRIGACMFGQAPAYLIVDRAARVASKAFDSREIGTKTFPGPRSAERRVGQGCGSAGRSRWSPYH